MVTSTTTPSVAAVNPREKALEDFRKKITEHKEIEARLKQSPNLLDYLKIRKKKQKMFV